VTANRETMRERLDRLHFGHAGTFSVFTDLEKNVNIVLHAEQ
jgi:hypothetical protein